MDLKGTKRRSTGLKTGCEKGEREVSRRRYEAVGWTETREDYMTRGDSEKEKDREREREAIRGGAEIRTYVSSYVRMTMYVRYVR